MLPNVAKPLHLLALLHERGQSRPQVLRNNRRIVPGQIVCGLDGDLVQHERRHDRVDGAHAKLVQILRSEPFRDAQQPLDVLAVRWIAGVLGLRSVIVYAPSQGFEGEHAGVVRC